jgi:hypothetical protein
MTDITGGAARRAIGGRPALPIDAVAAIDAVIASEELHPVAHARGCAEDAAARWVDRLIDAWIDRDFDARDTVIDELDDACPDCMAEVVDRLACAAAHYFGEWTNADLRLAEQIAEQAAEQIAWEPVEPGPGQMELL